MPAHLGVRKDASFSGSNCASTDPKRSKKEPVVIEISSDSEHDVQESMTAPVTPKAKKRIVQPHKVIEILSSDEESQEVPTKFTQTPTKNRAGGTVTPSRSKAVHVVNLRRASSSDDASSNQQYTVLDKGKGRAKHTPSNRRVSRFADGPGSSADEAVSTDEDEVGSLMSTPKRPMTTAARGRIISRERSMTSDPSPERSASTASPKTPSPTKKQLPPSPSKTPPMKKGSDWRIQFAQDLYKSFNEEIFGGELPSDTPLIWNARYKSTAGRATYARNRLGEVKELRIDLSPKLLDDEDRIRFTLCHEMCHLASWMITEDDDQGHGEVFKKWAARAMRIRKDVVISMRHSYKINYSWEWSCVNCSWTHGRWTNSVDTEEWVCSAKTSTGDVCQGQLELTKWPAGASPTKFARTKSSKHAATAASPKPLRKSKRSSLSDEFSNIEVLGVEVDGVTHSLRELVLEVEDD